MKSLGGGRSGWYLDRLHGTSWSVAVEMQHIMYIGGRAIDDMLAWPSAVEGWEA